jgi:hypothetical protein
MGRRKSYPGIFGPIYYTDGMAPDMQISLGSFSGTPIGALITLILQILFTIVFLGLALIFPAICFYLAF